MTITGDTDNSIAYVNNSLEDETVHESAMPVTIRDDNPAASLALAAAVAEHHIYRKNENI